MLKNNEQKNKFILKETLGYYEFSSIKEMDNFLKIIENKTDKIVLGHSRHFWWAFFNMKHHNVNNKFKYNKIYGLCKSDTLLDRWNSEYENNLGMHTKTGIDCAQINDLFIQDDYLIQIFYSQEFIIKIDELYSNEENLKDPNFLTRLNKLFIEKHEVKVIITEDEKLADNIREKTLTYFKE